MDLITRERPVDVFSECIEKAFIGRDLQDKPLTKEYLVVLLTHFLRWTVARDEQIDSPVTLADISKPLTTLYRASLGSSDEAQRYIAVKNIAELALFLSGWFETYLALRKLPAHYIHVGAAAYGQLAIERHDMSDPFRSVHCFLADRRNFETLAQVLRVAKDRIVPPEIKRIADIYGEFLRTSNPDLMHWLARHGVRIFWEGKAS